MLIDASEFLKAVVSAPGVAALIGALYQLSRDQFDENYALFREILGLEEQQEVNEDYAVEAIKRKVRGILSVEQLT
jgi:hypothetical protein